MSVDKYIITQEDSNYSIIPNIVSQNLMDAEALGLYVYLLSLPPQWEFYKTVIRKHFNWGREKLDKKIALLKSHNLIDVIGNRNGKGQFIDWNLLVKNGRDFVQNQNTENPYSGELSTGLCKKDTQDTEKPAAVKPVTGFSTPINKTNTNTIAHRKKSFCSNEQKKSKSDWRQENATVHSFAESKNQMATETKHIEENETIKRAPMPDNLRSLIKKMKYNTHG